MLKKDEIKILLPMFALLAIIFLFVSLTPDPIPKDRLPDGYVELVRDKNQERLVVNSIQFIRVSKHPNNAKWTEIKASDGIKYTSKETLEKFLNKVRNQQR